METRRKPCHFCDGSGKHVLVRNSEGNFIAIKHDGPCPALPDRDRWVMYFEQYGTQLYTPIRFCPLCGRKLEGGE